MKTSRAVSALSLILAFSTPALAADDAPFWTGKPNATQFASIQAGRITKAKASIATMLAVKGKRTVENTLEPYDLANLQLDSANSQAGLIEEVHPDSAVRAAAEKASQDVSAYATELSLDRRVYDALAAIDTTGLDAETRFYLYKTLRDFRLAGVDKDQPTRDRVKALRDEEVKVGQDFDRNIRADVRSIRVAPAELAGLPDDFIAAHKAGADGKVKIDINYPDYIPFMTYAKSDDARHRLYMEYNNRAFPKNIETLDRLIAVRDSIAHQLGFPSWAEYITANKMVGSSEHVRQFIDKIVDASGSRADREYHVLLAAKRKDDPKASAVQFWESSYYSEQVRKSEYNFDSQSVRPYLPFDEVKQGILDVTSKLFGVEFRRVTDAPMWDPSVECYETWEGGKRVGRFYFDLHPRPDKYNHAAQFDIRTGVAGKQIPEAALICNFPGGKAGDPGLMEFDDVQTFLHEFGHLLHSQFSGRHRWEGTGGIKTEWDFVEAPSQMLEEWARDPHVLATFAKQYQTHQSIPADLVKQMNRARDYGEGLRTRRQMVYADMSLSYYNRPAGEVNTTAQMESIVKQYQPFPFVDGTHLQCAFGHLDGYSAIYYTYMWSLVIAKDMFSRFDRENLLAPEIAKRYRDLVLAPGGSAPAGTLVANFLGRPFGFESYRKWLNQEDVKTQAP